AMSVYRHKDSPFWRFDFERGGFRFFGTTDIPKDRPKSEAQAYEKAERRKAEKIVEAARQEQRQPMTDGTACGRRWDVDGQYTEETDLEDALDWLCKVIGPRRGLHTIRNDDVARAVAERRKCLVKAGQDDKGKQLYRPISARTVNRTVPFLLRRVMMKA